MLYLCAAGFGFAWGAGAVNPPLVAELFGLSLHGLILGVVTFVYSTGSAPGPFVAGYIFDITGSYQVAFLVCAAIGIVGLVLTTLVTPIRSERGKQ